jgi:hypothetical protein
LLNFITLSFWTVALGNLCFRLIGRAFGDGPYDARYGTYHASLSDDIAWQAATIIVTLPVFLYFDRTIARELARRPEMYESPVRLWLTYIALVIAATIVIGDAIWILQALFRGEVTLRFILEALVLLVLGGGVFAYYFPRLRPR